jgi:hypothetical protein
MEGQIGILDAARIVKELQLDLRGLNVLTECASGAYAFTPVLCCMAGAQVFAVGRDSLHGRFNTNRKRLERMLRKVGALDRCKIDQNVPDDVWKQVDIVTNLGFVRPISRKQIYLLKQTSTVALMYDASEFRTQDIDLEACRRKNIAVVGTNEGSSFINFYPYIGMMALKLLFNLGCEIYRSEIALLGSRFIGNSIAKTLETLGMNFDWFTPTGRERRKRCYPYSQLRMLLSKEHLDALVCAEFWDQRVLIGKKAAISFARLRGRYPGVRLGHICGKIDGKDLKQSGIRFLPQRLAGVHHLSYQLADLGYKPVMELNGMGLRAGAIVTRARREGLTVAQALRYVVQYGNGQKVL